MDQNLKLLRQLRYCILAHLVISTLTIVLWVITVVFFLKEYASFTVTVDSFELFLYILNICTVIYLLIFILIYKPHVVVKNRATSIIECAVWSIATLVVFYAMKLGIEKSLDLVLFYLDPASEVRHYENVLFISVTVFIISILYADYRVYREICNCEYSIANGADPDQMWQEEHQTELDANRQ